MIMIMIMIMSMIMMIMMMILIITVLFQISSLWGFVTVLGIPSSCPAEPEAEP